MIADRYTRREQRWIRAGGIGSLVLMVGTVLTVWASWFVHVWDKKGIDW
jgi:hypothetical protein